jgi:hypothetical protein
MSVKLPSHSNKGSNHQVGNAAVDTSRSYVDLELGALENEEATKHALNWGDYLRPHHFRFEEASLVRARRDGRADLVCAAVSVLGSGYFRETETSQPVKFDDGAVIVKAGQRVVCFPFEEFRERFQLMDGSPLASIYQIDFQTPKK